MVYLIFNTGTKWFREFKNKKEAHLFKQVFQTASTDGRLKIVNKKHLPDCANRINDSMFEMLIEICKREIRKD